MVQDRYWHDGEKWHFGRHQPGGYDADDGSWKYYKELKPKEQLRFDHMTIGRCAAQPEDCMCFYHQAIRQGACPKKLEEMRAKMAKSIEKHNMKDYEEIVDSVVEYARTYTPELGWSLGSFQDKAAKAQIDSSWTSWWQPNPNPQEVDDTGGTPSYIGVHPPWTLGTASSSSQGLPHSNPNPYSAVHEPIRAGDYNARADSPTRLSMYDTPIRATDSFWHSPVTSERSS